jgi:hypothetical protein
MRHESYGRRTTDVSVCVASLRDRLYSVILLNAHARTQDEADDTDNFHDDLNLYPFIPWILHEQVVKRFKWQNR